MKITISDIAKMSGVSKSTVSKILNNYSGISEETQKKVQEVIRQTGYQPTYSAQTLAKKKTNVIGVIYAGKLNASLNHPFFVEVINAFKQKIGSLGYDLLFFSNEKFTEDGEDYYARCRHFQVDGCIIIGGEELEPSIYQLVESEIPCITVDIQLFGQNTHYIMTDNVKASELVVDHFYQLGYRDIGIIGGIPSSIVTTQRVLGFRQTLAKYGLNVKENWIKYGDFYKESGYRAMKEILQTNYYPRALFVTSDMMALGVLDALREQGLKVPEDIAIVGCDDILLSRYLTPPLSSIRQESRQIGEKAALTLSQIIHKDEAQSVLIEPELIIRQSCGGKKE